MSDLEWLDRHGFEFFGSWTKPDQKLERKIAIGRTAGVYAFVVKETILYIGKASHLRGRVRSYNRFLKLNELKPLRAAHNGIATTLRYGQPVDVYVRKTESEASAACLESQIIAELGPLWNQAPGMRIRRIP